VSSHIAAKKHTDIGDKALYLLDYLRSNGYPENQIFVFTQAGLHSAREAALKYGMSKRRVQKLCEENRIPGVMRFSRMWLIPKGAEKPTDKRYTKGRSICSE